MTLLLLARQLVDGKMYDETMDDDDGVAVAIYDGKTPVFQVQRLEFQKVLPVLFASPPPNDPKFTSLYILMTSLWQFIATFALPAPLALLILLNVPVPKSLKKTTVGLVARVFEFPVLGNTIKLLHLMLITLLGAVVLSIQTLRSMKEATDAPSGKEGVPTSVYEAVRLNKRWRAERNLWLSAFAFTMWTVLAVFYREMARRLRVEDRLAEFETSDCTGTIDSTVRDVSVSKEVTSRAQVLSPRSGGGFGAAGGSPQANQAIKEAIKTLSNNSGGSTGSGKEGRYGKKNK